MTSISDTNVVNAPGGLVELAYVEKISNQTITNGAAAAIVLGPLSFVSDGSPCIVDVYVPRIDSGASTDIYFLIEVDGVSPTVGQGRIWNWTPTSAWNNPASAHMRIAPSAGVHTVTIKAVSIGANATITCASANWTPAFLRISKVIQASQLIVQTPNAPLVTSLPSDAIDGQEVRYLADNTNGIIWNFRYRAGSSSANKWEFIGGAPISTQHDNGTQYTLTHAAGSYSDVLTKAVPLAGDYLINGACLLTTTSGNDAIICINTTTSRNINYYVARMSNAASQYENGNRTIVLSGLAANTTVALSDYHVAQGSGSTVGNANLVITPIRVSA
jgi:hypothetical protein